MYVHHINREVSSLAASVDFYTNLLGFQRLKRPPGLPAAVPHQTNLQDAEGRPDTEGGRSSAPPPQPNSSSEGVWLLAAPPSEEEELFGAGAPPGNKAAAAYLLNHHLVASPNAGYLVASPNAGYLELHLVVSPNAGYAARHGAAKDDRFSNFGRDGFFTDHVALSVGLSADAYDEFAKRVREWYRLYRDRAACHDGREADGREEPEVGSGRETEHHDGRETHGREESEVFGMNGREGDGGKTFPDVPPGGRSRSLNDCVKEQRVFREDSSQGGVVVGVRQLFFLDPDGYCWEVCECVPGEKEM